MKRATTTLLSALTVIAVLFTLSACGKSVSDRLVGTYASTDGQELVLLKNQQVQYADPAHDDSATGTWEIKDHQVLVHRSTDGEPKSDIHANIPDGDITSLAFTAVEGDTRSNFHDTLFLRH